MAFISSYHENKSDKITLIYMPSFLVGKQLVNYIAFTHSYILALRGILNCYIVNCIMNDDSLLYCSNLIKKVMSDIKETNPS